MLWMQTVLFTHLYNKIISATLHTLAYLQERESETE